MNNPLRVLDTGLMPARWNIAMSAALAELHCVGAIPDTLRFHRYPRSVLVGRHQRLRREVRAERCHSKKIELARLGLPARFKSPDEIVIDGRRNGGVSAEYDGSSLMVQGTIEIEHALRRAVARDTVGVEETELTERLFADEIGTEAFVADSHGRELAASAREAHFQ